MLITLKLERVMDEKSKRVWKFLDGKPIGEELLDKIKSKANAIKYTKTIIYKNKKMHQMHKHSFLIIIGKDEYNDIINREECRGKKE